jgi:hypothetical protein
MAHPINQSFKADVNKDLIHHLLGSYPTDTQGQPLISIKEFHQQGLIKGHTCHILTILVNESNSQGLVPNNRKHKWGTSEDNSYKCHQVLHRSAPRCYSYVRVINDANGQIMVEKRMHGFYKFSSSDPNNEDEDIACHLIDPEQQKQADLVAVTEKANGKSAVITAFQYQGQTYLFGGSKSKHRVARLSDAVGDIKAVEALELGPHANQLVTDIFTYFIQQFATLSPDQKNKLIDMMLVQSLCGEYNDYKHIVSNQMGKLKPSIQWFGISQNLGTIANSASLNGNFLANLEVIKAFGLPTIAYQIYPRADYLNQITSLKTRCDSEGYVVHWIRSQDNTTVGVEKLKTWWYVILRMLREIIRGSAKSGNLRDVYEIKIQKTILKRNQDFMNLPDGFILIWSQLCCEFCKWFLKKGYNFNVIDFNENSQGMGNTWQEFLAENPHISDQFGVPEEEVKARHLENYKFKLEIKSIPRLVVFFKGIPGLGKSHIGHLLATELNSKGYQTTTLEQDDFKGKTAGKQCFMAFCNYLKNKDNRIILLQRNNANLSQYQSYLEEARNQGCRILTLVPDEIRTISLLLTCIEAVLARKGHKTFDLLAPEVKAKLVLTYAIEFADDYQPPNNSAETVYKLKWLSMVDDSHVSPSMKQFLNNYLTEIKQAKNVFNNTVTRPLAQVLYELQIKPDQKLYATWRRNQSEMIEELMEVIVNQVQVE